MKGFFSPLIAVVVLSTLFLATAIIYASQNSNQAAASLLEAKKVNERAYDVERLINFTIADAYVDACVSAYCANLTTTYCPLFMSKLATYTDQLKNMLPTDIQPIMTTAGSTCSNVIVKATFLSTKVPGTLTNKIYSIPIPITATCASTFTLFDKPYSITCSHED